MQTNQANIYSPDKGIEFEAVYNDTLEMIRGLKSVNVTGYDIDFAIKQTKSFKEECESQLKGACSKNYMEQAGIRATAESIYNEGIRKLKSIQSDLWPYNVYYTSHYSVQNMRNSLNQNEGEEQIKAFASAIIIILKQINESDTRLYSTEASVVEEIYTLAYELMKKEMLIFGKSSILVWAQGIPVASSFFRCEILKDIDNLKSVIDNQKIETILAKIRSQSLNPSYLDEELISYLSNYSSVNIDEILPELEKLSQSLQSCEDNLSVQRQIADETGAEVKKATSILKKSDFLKTIALSAAFIGALGVFCFASFKFSNRNAITPLYKTYKEIHSTGVDIQTPNAPEYLPLLTEDEKIKLIEYMPWNHVTFDTVNYRRDINTYDVSGIKLENVEDYLGIDYKGLCTFSSEDEGRLKIDLERTYDEAILEVVSLSQDLNDVDYDDQTKYTGPIFGGVLMWGIALWLFNATVKCTVTVVRESGERKEKWGVIRSYFTEINNSFAEFFQNAKNRKEIGEKLKKELEELKRITTEDEQIRGEIEAILNKYQDFLPEEIQEKYQSLTRKK